MDTTKLYVEYIVIGMETLGWIVLILISLLKGAMLNFLDYCTKNIVSTIILISVCYILGLITDRASDKIFEKRKIKIKNKYDIQSKTSILVWEHLEEKTFVMFTLSRIRLLRSTTINAFFLMVTSIWLAQGVYDNWKLAAFLGILFVVIAVESDGAHRNLLDNYYRKTAYVEKSYWKQKSQRGN